MGSLLTATQTVKEDQKGECLSNLSYGWSYLNTFNESSLTDYHYELCYTMVAMEDWARYLFKRKNRT